MRVEEELKKKVTPIRMDADMKGKAQEAARRERLTFSEWVRRAIELALRRAV